MNFADARVVHHRLHVADGDFTAGHHLDALSGFQHKLLERRHGVNRRFLAARGEHAIHADLGQVIERLGKIFRHIEGAMTSDLQRTSQFHELLHARLVNVTFEVEHAENHAAGAKLLSDEDIALHDAEFISRIAEVAAAWTDHHLQTDLDLFAHCSDHAGAGRGASFRQSGAEFHA